MTLPVADAGGRNASVGLEARLGGAARRGGTFLCRLGLVLGPVAL
jgi:hypothetical protein